MPSKNGFGNTRKKSPAMKYGAGKNPITMKSPLLGVKVKPKETTSGSRKKVDGPVASGNRVDVDMTQFNDKLRTKDGKVLTKKQYADSKLRL